MERRLGMKCSGCGHWNRVPVNKAFFEPDNQPEPKVKVMIPMYQPLQIMKCEKCGRTIAERMGVTQQAISLVLLKEGNKGEVGVRI